MLVSPVLARTLPFAVFIFLMIVESGIKSMAPSVFYDVQFVLYPIRVLLTSAALVWLWIFVEKRWPSLRGLSLSAVGIAVATGTAVILFWIVIGPFFRLGIPTNVNPIPQDAMLGPLWLLMRFAGASLLVPIIEELFWRSFVTRRIDAVDVDELAPQATSWKAIGLSSAAFALAHNEVVAGFVTGVAFCWLYRRRGDLREAFLAHAVANALLFFYVVKFSAFEFWG